MALVITSSFFCVLPFFLPFAAFFLSGCGIDYSIMTSTGFVSTTGSSTSGGAFFFGACPFLTAAGGGGGAFFV
jgi:hypothetical protein